MLPAGLVSRTSAIGNASTNWWLALVAILVIIVANIWGKGMIKIIPILLGVVVSYIVALIFGQVDFSVSAQAVFYSTNTAGNVRIGTPESKQKGN